MGQLVRLLNKPLISGLLLGPSLRSLSFLDRFCKKDREGAGSGADVKVNVQLDNAFKLYNLETEPHSTVCLTQMEARKFYVNMQTIRRFENACANLYKEKTIRGFCHLYVGQEACCVGIHAAMRSNLDTVITSYRSHGWTWLMAVSIYSLIAELCQKSTGCSRGKGGSMHTFAPCFFGGNGIVGAQVPLGAGLALAHAYRCDGGVNFACYGDGAANQGQIHEVFNIACLWKLPVVFVCENNKYGMGTPIQRSSCSTDYYTRGDYIPGLWVNGMDILAVRSAAEFAIKHACICGPLVMEMETYRYHGHSMSDPGTSYRKREEVQMMRQKYDPIMTFRELCLRQCLLTEEEFKQIDMDIKKEVDDAVARAKADKEPDLQELTTDVYAHNLEKSIRGTVWQNLQHHNVGQSLVPLGTPKATPKSQITEMPKAEAKKDGKGVDAPKKDVKGGEELKQEVKSDGSPKGPVRADKTNTKSDTEKLKNDETVLKDSKHQGKDSKDSKDAAKPLTKSSTTAKDNSKDPTQK